MEVKAEIEEKIKIAEQGGQLTFVFTDTLKDETRPIEKVRISSSPTAYRT